MTAVTRHATTPAAPTEPNWREHAACAEVDGELFFPIGDNAEARLQASAAKQVCASCPVRETCLAWALANRQDQGVWGGMTEEERYQIHRRRGEGYWARRRNVADHIVKTRLDEFTALLGRDLSRAEIAASMGTNVQTVNRVLERYEASRTATREVTLA